MALYSNRYYRELIKELFPSYSTEEIEALVKSARARAIAEDYRNSSRIEDRGERIEDKGTYTYPLLGRKLRLTERQKLENVQKSRTLDAVENKNAKKYRKEVV